MAPVHFNAVETDLGEHPRCAPVGVDHLADLGIGHHVARLARIRLLLVE